MMSKWISADSIINKFNSHVGFTTCADVERAIKLIQDEPSVYIVFCKECKYEERCRKAVEHITHEPKSVTIGCKAVDFCSYGERKNR